MTSIIFNIHMKRNIHQQLLRNLKYTVLTLLGFSVFSLSAQMSGSYTIDASSGATSTNFQDWYSFWRSLQGLSRSDGGALHSGGVSGPVTVDVKSSLTETSPIEFPSITGMNSTNTVTINGNGNAVELGTSYQVINFTGGDYFTLDDLIIRNTSNGSFVKIVRFSNNSDYNTIKNCTLEFSSLTTGSTSGQAYVAWATSQTSNTSTTTTDNGKYNTVSGCLMRTTNSNSPGPGFAVVDQQGTSGYTSTPSNNTVSDNVIQNFFYYAYYTRYTNGNHFKGNDISRANSTSKNLSSTVMVIYSYYTYSTNRSTEISDNYIHDLPYSGAPISQGISTFYGIYGWYNYGNSGNRYQITGNKMENIQVAGRIYYSYLYYSDFVDIKKNHVIRVNNNNNTTNYSYGWYFYYGEETNFSQNIIEKCTTTYYTYYTYFFRHDGTWNYCEDNIIRNNESGYYTYALYSYYGNWQMSRNAVLNNEIDDTRGYLYAIAPYYVYNVRVFSNLVAGNVGAYGVMGIYAYSFNSGSYSGEIRNNTVQTDGSTSQYAYHYGYGIYVYLYYHNEVRVTGNIVSITGGYGAYPVYTYNRNGQTAYKEWDYNTYWVDQSNISFERWYLNGSSAGSYAGYQALGFGGPNENYLDPEWMNPSGNDYRSTVFETQNNSPANPDNPLDVLQANRNIHVNDRGAVKSYTDLKAVSTNFTVPSTVCAGYTTSGGTTITVENLFATDTAKDFYVSYSVNGGTPVREMVTTGILPGKQGTITFLQPLTLNELGNNRIAIFIDLPDDNVSNDSFIFNTFVKPAPGGSKWNFSSEPTWAIYQKGKLNDVTVVDQPVIYDMNPPRKYTNADYNQNPGWTASAWAETASGALVTGASIVDPSGSDDLEYTFVTSDLSLEDSMITLFLKISDNENGCDTIIKRNVLIYPTIVPDFKFPAKICDGDAVLFEQLSTVQSGNMEFNWDFGTGNPDDLTQAPEPVFQFPGSGTYKVIMTAKTLPYGFPSVDSATITVSPIPSVKFTKLNACEGLDLVFTNQTTPANSTYLWDFGDGKTSVLTSPTHKYATTGQYTVTLKANLNGCIAELSQRAYQFDKPKASFKIVSGSCDNDEFLFDNTSTIKSGLFGNNWDFNDGNVSTEEDPSHMFANSGVKDVKLLTTSEFGCTDEKIVQVIVKESPKTDFTHDPACSLTPTDFTNTTPVVSGTTANFVWDFGDGGMSTAESPSHSWSALGPKTVMLKVTLDNGCAQMVSKDLFVGVQPAANFDASNVCAGEPVVFENNTTWAQGDISYDWNFGDNTTSTNSDPQKSYNVTATTTYNVTLKASIAGGCSDEITKQVTVNEGPQTCNFVANPDYSFGFYGMSLEPVDGSGNIGAQTGVQYTWVFQGGGTQQGPTTQYNFQEDGSYNVTMRAKVLSTGCVCTSNKTVVMNRTAVDALVMSGISVFPNPNSGQFHIALQENFGDKLTIEVMTTTGQIVKSIETTNSGLVTVETGDVADGMYLVRVRSGKRVSTSRVNIRR